MLSLRFALLPAVATLACASVLLAGGAVRVPLDVPTIAEALPLAGEGGVIQVAEGTHEGGFTIDHSVTIQGGFPADFDGDPDPWIYITIVVAPDGGNAANVNLGTGDTVLINGLSFVGGITGINASLVGDSQLALTAVTCQDNSQGINMDVHDTASVSATMLFLVGNIQEGAGAGLWAGVDGDAVVVVAASEISNNSTMSGGAGAAIIVSGNAAVQFTDTLFVNNGYLAGGQVNLPGTLLYDVSGAGALFLEASRVEQNIPATLGDAAIGGTQTAESLVQIVNTEFRAGPNGLGGEAINAQVAGISALRLIENSFENASNLVGPVIHIMPDEQGVAFVLRNTFVGNSSSTHLITTEQFGSSFVNFDGNIVRSNVTAGETLALSVSAQAAGALLRVINNQVSANESTAAGGGGRFTVDGPNLAQVGYNTFVGNTAVSGTAGIHLVASFISPAQASNNIAIDNTAGGAPADVTIEGFLANSIGNFVTGDGDPGFQDPDQGNFHLRSDSVLINAADPNGFEIDHDFEEDNRPIGDAADVGSDEATLMFCATDLDSDGVTGASDLAMLLGSWGPCEACPADFDNDGTVGAADLAVLLGAWGDCV